MSTRSSYDNDYEDIDNSYEDDDDYDAYDDDEEKGVQLIQKKKQILKSSTWRWLSTMKMMTMRLQNAFSSLLFIGWLLKRIYIPAHSLTKYTF